MSIRDLTDRILKRDLTRPALVIAAGKLGILFVRDLLAFRTGAIDGRELRLRTGGNVGSSAGIVAGAAAGMAFGSLLPGVGNVIGAFTGGLFGAMGGEHVGRLTASYMEKHVAPPSKTENGHAKTNGKVEDHKDL
jgi:phage tail tape-measure protein